MATLPYDGSAMGLTDAQVASYSRLAYPNPFFDLSRHYFPKSVKTLFRYCRIFYYQNEFIHNIITKLAAYPITDFIFERVEDKTVKENYKELVEHHLKLKSFLVECGLDYYVYGNCVVSANMKFKRFLECPICQDSAPAEKRAYRWVSFSFVGDCAKCGNHGVTFTINDQYLKNPKYFKLIRWAPENINIDHDDLTGESRYFYTMNDKIKKGITNGKREIIERVPELFIRAIKENKKIELDPKNLYHFKRPTLAEEDQGWGKPLLLASMKSLWYMQTLRRGNEAVVAEHLVPMRSLFPAAQANLDPYSSLNLGKWRAGVEDQLVKWRKDPNSVGIFPIPIGYQSLGGDARVLMVTPELKFLEESTINAMGVPIEFIKGGSTWTSSSVSLRIVENMFINYREQMTEFLNYFVVPKIKYFLGYPPVKIKLKKFKMQDDLQAKELLLQLSQGGKLSDTTLLEEFGIDPLEEREVRRSDSTFTTELMTDQMKAQAESQGKGTVLSARYQALAQLEMAEATSRNIEQKFQAELVKELGITDKDPSDVLQKQALIIMNIPAPQQQQYLAQLQQQTPLACGFILARLQTMGVIPSPQEQRVMEMEQGKEKQMKLEGKISEQEHNQHQAETKLKMKHDAQKHQHKMEESKTSKESK